MQLFAPANLPILLPGETLYSWCGAVHRWNGNASGSETSMQLFGSPRAGFFHDFPSHLDALLARVEGSIGTAEDVISGHTLLGFYLPFVPVSRAQEICLAVRAGTVSRLKFHLALPKSGIGADHPLKACQECCAADEPEHGRSIWYLEHQLPSVLVCRRHSRPLDILVDTHTPVHRRDWLLPRSGPHRTWLPVTVHSSAGLDQLQRLAELSAMVLNAKPSELAPAGLSDAYAQGLKNRFFLKTDGSVDRPVLERAFSECFSPLAYLPGLSFLGRKTADFVQSLEAIVSGGNPSVHPLKHILFISLLFDSWRELEAALNRQSGVASQGRGSETTIPDPANDARIVKLVALVEAGRSITAAARELGVTTTTGVRWAKIAGISYTPRTKTLTDDVLNKVRALLCAGNEKSAVLAKTRISAVSLNRLISSEPDIKHTWDTARAAKAQEKYRQRFLAILKRHPGLPMQEIRKKPGNGFQWLYRNDREWLIEHLPAIWRSIDPDKSDPRPEL
jgi:hypothetical protein